MSKTAATAKKRLRDFATDKNAQIARWFFKTGKGGYSEHDRFIGVKVPNTRLVAKEFLDLPLSQIQILFKSKIHEERLLALVILVLRSKKANPKTLAMLYQFYTKNIQHVNNWDLVDLSAEHVMGRHLFRQPRKHVEKILRKLALSSDLWKKRISILTTFHFIREKDFQMTLQMADLLLEDEHDLIHKAVGWMLREVGNRDLKTEENFLRSRYRKMPRTMLRYAIEKFPEAKRQKYLKGQI